jgi:NADH:ubiquinone oxidoreductase subunit 3 (subunit A)
MREILLSPPAAFLIYLVLVGMLAGAGRVLAGAPHPSSLKSSTYASGEAAPSEAGAPGYRPFFAVGLFFAVLHLGVLLLATGGLTPIAGA